MQGASGTPIAHTLLIDGRNAVTERGTEDVFFYSWDSRAVANGTHTLTYHVTDGAGRTGSVTRTVSVDNSSAAAASLLPEFTSPAEGAVVSGLVQVQASFSGAATSIQLTLTMDSRCSSSSGTATSAVYAWDTTLVPDGLHVFSLVVQDLDGRLATTSRTFRVAMGVHLQRARSRSSSPSRAPTERP